MMEKVLFVINPISGTKRKESLYDLIPRILHVNGVAFEIVETQYAGHASELTLMAIKSGFDCVVAVGGDGTVNEIGATLAGSDVVLGIVPLGSGNGLARSLKLSGNPEQAINQILTGKTVEVDTMVLNDHNFVNMAGIGFDAWVAHNFSTQKKRGIAYYIKAMLESYLDFTPLDLTYSFEGRRYEEKAFVMSFANSGQYGNNAYIAPMADFSDGLIDVAILSPFPKPMAPAIGLSLVTHDIHKSKYYHHFKTDHVEINMKSVPKVHVDGEAIHTRLPIHVSVTDRKLRVVCG